LTEGPSAANFSLVSGATDLRRRQARRWGGGVIERSDGIRIRDAALRRWFPSERDAHTEQGRLVTNSLFAVPRLRSVGLLVGLALLLPFAAVAQDGPKGGQDSPPKGGQDAPPKGDPKKGQDGGKDDKAKSKAEEALEKVKEKARRDAGESERKKDVEMEKAGVARKKLEDVRNIQRVPIPQPTRDVMAAVAAGQADRTQLRRWARYQISLFTDPAQDRNVQKNHDEILRVLKLNAGNQNAATIRTELIAYCDELINKNPEPRTSTFAKVNMVTLIDELHAEEAGRSVTGVDVLINTLRNHEQHGDAVLFVAMNALVEAKKRGLTTVQQERESAKTLMQIARRGELQPLLLETLCKTLGVIGMPFEGLVNEAAEIATFLANIATNENLLERTRIEAAIALGKLRKQDLVNNYKYEVEAWVLGKAYLTYLNWVVENRAADPPKVGPNAIRYLGARQYDAVRTSMQQAAGAPGQARLNSLLTTIEPSLKDILEDKDPDREPIAQWVEQNKVQPLRLARQAQEIKPVQKAAAAPAPAAGAAAAAGK
jgi:hypothetical protein